VVYINIPFEDTKENYSFIKIYLFIINQFIPSYI